jgi:hypothetical protein
MKIFIICVTATLAVATFPWTPVQAAYPQRGVVLDSFGRLIWCGNSGYDNGPPRELGPGTGSCRSGTNRLPLDLASLLLSRDRP